MRRKLAGCALLTVAAMLLGAAPGGAGRPAKVRLVIGKPVLAPAHALSSKKLTVAFKVTRSDTRRAVAAAKVVPVVTVAGKAVRAAGAFRHGQALVAYTLPPNAMGKRTTVKVTVKSGGRSATRVAAGRSADTHVR